MSHTTVYKPSNELKQSLATEKAFTNNFGFKQIQNMAQTEKNTFFQDSGFILKQALVLFIWVLKLLVLEGVLKLLEGTPKSEILVQICI